MSRTKTPSFILELPLVVSPRDERVIVGRLEAGRRVYNATLGAMLHRMDAMRTDPAWKAAQAMPSGEPKSAVRAARNKAFAACRERYRLTSAECQKVAEQHRDAGGFGARLGGHPTQTLSLRVWKAIERHAFSAKEARTGRPRFKGKKRPLHSLEGKEDSALRWRENAVEWNGIALAALIPGERKDPYVHLALQSRTKYCRVLWRMLRGRRRWYVQIVKEGLPPAKYAFHAAGAVVGVDLGPSSVAIVSDDTVSLQSFAPSVTQPWKDTRKLQRKLDRSRRAMNPENFNANGTVKHSARTWKSSSRYTKNRAALAELERVLAARRETDHGTLVNQVLALGTVVHLEQLSYVALQKAFGRSVKVRAPGMFVELLHRKAESAGGAVVELNTGSLKMSQYDHVTDSCTKKPLRQRWHPLGGISTGQWVQRDCYSAFLAQQVDPAATEGGTHNPPQLAVSWGTVEPRWSEAGVCVEYQSASGAPSETPTVPIPSERIACGRSPARGHRRFVAPATAPEAP